MFSKSPSGLSYDCGMNTFHIIRTRRNTSACSFFLGMRINRIFSHNWNVQEKPLFSYINFRGIVIFMLRLLTYELYFARFYHSDINCTSVLHWKNLGENVRSFFVCWSWPVLYEQVGSFSIRITQILGVSTVFCCTKACFCTFKIIGLAWTSARTQLRFAATNQISVGAILLVVHTVLNCPSFKLPAMTMGILDIHHSIQEFPPN